MTTRYEIPGVNPFRRYNWHGSTLDWTGEKVDDLPEDESVVAACVWSYESGGTWDGEVACIVQLIDGRFAAWETFYGPTGNGFCEDAYGGGANVTIARSVEEAIRLGLSGDNQERAARETAQALAEQIFSHEVQSPDELRQIERDD